MSDTTAERTEKATPKRMEEVRREGKLSTSRDMTAWVSMGAAALVLPVVVNSAAPVLGSSGALPLTALVGIGARVITTVLQAAILAGVGLAAVDLFVVMRRNRKYTRMTRQEIKDEAKTTEGDPHIRGQRRSRALAISRNRMIAAVA